MFVIALFTALWAALAPAPATPSRPATLDQTFTKILQDIADENARGDDAAYDRRAAQNFFSVDEKGSIFTRSEALAKPPSAQARERIQREMDEAKLSERVLDVHADLYGNAAVVRSRLVMTLVLNGEPVSKQLRDTHVFVRDRGGWRLVSMQETAIPLDPIPVPSNHKLYDEYVGHYRLLSTRTYTITRDGDRLFWGNAVKRELVPESDNTFVIKGDQYRVIFLRDAGGAVTHLRLREFPGVEYSAIRIRG